MSPNQFTTIKSATPPTPTPSSTPQSWNNQNEFAINAGSIDKLIKESERRTPSINPLLNHPIEYNLNVVAQKIKNDILKSREIGDFEREFMYSLMLLNFIISRFPKAFGKFIDKHSIPYREWKEYCEHDIFPRSEDLRKKLIKKYDQERERLRDVLMVEQLQIPKISPSLSHGLLNPPTNSNNYNNNILNLNSNNTNTNNNINLSNPLNSNSPNVNLKRHSINQDNYHMGIPSSPNPNSNLNPNSNPNLNSNPPNSPNLLNPSMSSINKNLTRHSISHDPHFDLRSRMNDLNDLDSGKKSPLRASKFYSITELNQSLNLQQQQQQQHQQVINNRQPSPKPLLSTEALQVHHPSTISRTASYSQSQSLTSSLNHQNFNNNTSLKNPDEYRNPSPLSARRNISSKISNYNTIDPYLMGMSVPNYSENLNQSKSNINSNTSFNTESTAIPAAATATTTEIKNLDISKMNLNPIMPKSIIDDYKSLINKEKSEYEYLNLLKKQINETQNKLEALEEEETQIEKIVLPSSPKNNDDKEILLLKKQLEELQNQLNKKSEEVEDKKRETARILEERSRKEKEQREMKEKEVKETQEMLKRAQSQISELERKKKEIDNEIHTFNTKKINNSKEVQDKMKALEKQLEDNMLEIKKSTEEQLRIDKILSNQQVELERLRLETEEEDKLKKQMELERKRLVEEQKQEEKRRQEELIKKKAEMKRLEKEKKLEAQKRRKTMLDTASVERPSTAKSTKDKPKKKKLKLKSIKNFLGIRKRSSSNKMDDEDDKDFDEVTSPLFEVDVASPQTSNEAKPDEASQKTDSDDNSLDSLDEAKSNLMIPPQRPTTSPIITNDISFEVDLSKDDFSYKSNKFENIDRNIDKSLDININLENRFIESEYNINNINIEQETKIENQQKEDIIAPVITFSSTSPNIEEKLTLEELQQPLSLNLPPPPPPPLINLPPISLDLGIPSQSKTIPVPPPFENASNSTIEIKKKIKNNDIKLDTGIDYTTTKTNTESSKPSLILPSIHDHLNAIQNFNKDRLKKVKTNEKKALSPVPDNSLQSSLIFSINKRREAIGQDTESDEESDSDEEW